MSEVQMQLWVVSTCGTSLLTNGADDETRKWLVRIANEGTLDQAGSDRLGARARECRARLDDADVAGQRRLSAELNGVHAVLERWPARSVHHVLIHTDTAVGKAAAELVEAVLRRAGGSVQLLTAGGLRTSDLASFREALAEITRDIEAMAPALGGATVVFNLTGGFKSINGYLQALGMVYADRCVFLFEGAPELMEIPRLPVRLADVDEVRAHIDVFRRLAVGYELGPEEVRGVPDSLLLTVGGGVGTSVWGDVVWERVKGPLLAERLWPPLSNKLRVAKAAEHDFGKLEGGRRRQVNEAFDRFAAHLDHGRPLLASNTFKKLQGDPAPPSTHELYLWSDGGACRAFGRYDRDLFVVEKIGVHL